MLMLSAQVNSIVRYNSPFSTVLLATSSVLKWPQVTLNIRRVYSVEQGIGCCNDPTKMTGCTLSHNSDTC